MNQRSKDTCNTAWEHIISYQQKGLTTASLTQGQDLYQDQRPSEMTKNSEFPNTGHVKTIPKPMWLSQDNRPGHSQPIDLPRAMHRAKGQFINPCGGHNCLHDL